MWVHYLAPIVILLFKLFFIHQDYFSYCSRAVYIPFDADEKVLGDLVYVEYFISGEDEEETALQSHLPQLLGRLVCIQAAVAQQEADYKKHSQQHLRYNK